MFKVIEESKQPVRKYSYEDIIEIQNKGGTVTGKVIKCTAEDILLVDLGDNLIGELHITDFEDTDKSTPKVALISRVGNPIEAVVEAVYGNKVILNRARLQKEYKETVLKNLKKGQIFDTVVYSLAPFGVFVELGKGVLALLPLDGISLSRISSLQGVFHKGMPLKVIFKEIRNGLYVVSHKELLGTWKENSLDFAEGEIVQGVIRDIKEYGAFIEVAPNLSGLADLPEFPVVIGDSVSVLIKKMIPEYMKLKLHIIDITETSYEVRYNYKITEGFVDKWVYNPVSDVTSKKIETQF